MLISYETPQGHKTMQTDDLRIALVAPISPAILIEEIPLDEKGIALINNACEQATRIVQGEMIGCWLS